MRGAVPRGPLNIEVDRLPKHVGIVVHINIPLGDSITARAQGETFILRITATIAAT